MGFQTKYLALGWFVITGVALIVCALILLGSGRYLEERETFETYVDQSVQGLEKGSAVKFRGVQIGEVDVIDFTSRYYEQYKKFENKKRYVLIRVNLKPGIFRSASSSVEEVLENEVKRGLRARLASMGLTGSSYLEMDYLNPETNPPLQIPWDPHYYYIPSAQAAFTRIISAAEEVLVNMRNIDFKALVGNLDELISESRDKLAELKINELIDNAALLVAEVRESNRMIQESIRGIKVSELSENTLAILDKVDRLIDSPKLRNLLGRLELTLHRLEQWVVIVQHDLSDNLDNLGRLTDNLTELTEDAKEYPARILFGEPPPRNDRR